MTEYHFKTPPMRHQVKALKKFLRAGVGALFAEMGTGKTKVAIDWAAALGVKKNARMRAVVACPKSVLTVWPREIRKHDPWGEVPHIGVEWRVVSIDSLWRPSLYDDIVLWLEEVPFEERIFIADESSHIKSPSAQRSKGAYLVAKRCRHRMVMSGTPMGRKRRLDLFMQYKVVDESIFGTSYDHFKKSFALVRAYKVVAWVRTKTFKRRIRPVTFSVKRKDCLDLPERFGHIEDPHGPNIVPITLSPRTRKLYDQLAAEAYAEFEQLEVITPIILTKLLRLSQLTGGWLAGLTVAGGKPGLNQKLARQVGKEKMLQLEYDLDEMIDQEQNKVVIFVRFLNELRDAAISARRAGYNVLTFHGGVPTKLRERKIDAFHATERPTAFISQSTTGSLGIDLTAASECIWYNPNVGVIPYLQGSDRLHRYGQKHEVNYRHYCADGTLDYAAMQGLMEDKAAEREILEDPDLLFSSSVPSPDSRKSRAGKRRR